MEVFLDFCFQIKTTERYIQGHDLDIFQTKKIIQRLFRRTYTLFIVSAFCRHHSQPVRFSDWLAIQKPLLGKTWIYKYLKQRSHSNSYFFLKLPIGQTLGLKQVKLHPVVNSFVVRTLEAGGLITEVCFSNTSNSDCLRFHGKTEQLHPILAESQCWSENDNWDQ